MKTQELSIIKYLKEHGLEKALINFKLKAREYPHKVLIKYDQIESDMNLEEVQDCRGLILEKNTWAIMCLSFRKFFNSEETKAAKIDRKTAHILEKLDGSMIQVYWDWVVESWFAATTGTGEGEGEVNNKLGLNFNDLFWTTLSEKYNVTADSLDKNYVYVFELTTPYNIVVKPHGTSSATLIAIRDMRTLLEFSYTDVIKIGAELGLPVVKSYDLNAENFGHIIETFKEMVWHEEGYVIVDANFNRVKIKNPAYVAVHHLKSKTAQHNILEVVKSNEIDEFAATFPERKDEITRLKIAYDKLVTDLEEIWIELQNHKPKNITKEEQKKYAMKVFELAGDNKLIKQFSGLFFSLKDGKTESVKTYMFNYDNKRLYEIL